MRGHSLWRYDALTALVMDEDNLGFSSLLRARVTDGFSSLTNRLEGMQIAMERVTSCCRGSWRLWSSL